MNKKERAFQDLSSEEKLDIIESSIERLNNIAGEEYSDARIEWLRRHIPAYKHEDGKNFVFISYSHKDYKTVYSDLAFFSYNSKKRVRFWYDEGLKPGDKWFEDAEKVLSSPGCVGVLFYLSESFLKSPSILKEIDMVKRYKKPYFTTTLEEGKICASDYLSKEEDTALLEKVDDIFPCTNTAVPSQSISNVFSDNIMPETYSPKHEDVLYRIDKIEQTFSVVENVFSDFIFEEAEDGLSLTGYKGTESEIYIPERVEGKFVIEVKATFDNAQKIYIPQTVKRILPATLHGFSYLNITNNLIEDMVRATETLPDIEKNKTPDLHDPQVIFGNADNLKYIEVSKNNPCFYDKDGILYSGDTLLRYPPKKLWDNKYLEGIKTIGTGAVFNHHERELPFIPENPPTIPSSVEEIGAHAFSNCTFWDIDISKGVKRIGTAAFAGYSCCEANPIALVIPESVEHIGENAFKGSNLPSITVLAQLEMIPRGAFSAFMGEMIEFKHGVKSIGERAFAQCINLKVITIPDISGKIGEYAFSGCKQLKNMTIPSSVTEIGDSAFSYCSSLSELKLSSGIKRIESGAFAHCSALRSVTLPDDIEYLSPSSFNECRSLLAIFYNGSRYEDLVESSGLLNGMLEAYTSGADASSFADELIHKIIIKTQWFERLKLKTILKIGDFLKKYE